MPLTPTQYPETFATDLTFPLSSAIDVGMATAIQTAQDSGTLVIGTRASAAEVATDSGWVSAQDDLESASRMWDRSGFPTGGTDTFRIDYATEAARMLLPDTLYLELSEDYELGGVNAGTVDGTPAYDPPEEEATHVAHAGIERTEGLREFFVAVPGFKVADTHEEHLIGSVDLAGDGDDLIPDHMMLAEETVLGVGGADVDPVSRHMSPPLWSIIHGSRGAAGRPIAPLTTLARAGGLYHPDVGGFFPGLTAAQANDLMAWQAATLAVNGMVPVFQTVAEHFAHRLTHESSEAPVAFVGTLFDALTDTSWCAQFLSYGLRELPLVVHYATSGLAEHNLEHNAEHGIGGGQALNPCRAEIIALVRPDLRPAVFPPLIGPLAGVEHNAEHNAEHNVFGTGWSSQHSFYVPTILHSVWRDRATGDICLVLVNWTSSAFAGTIGWFNPWLYWSGGQHSHEHNAEHSLTEPYRIDRLNQDGTTTTIASGILDSSSLVASGVSGTISGRDLSLGSVPAYSVQAYRFSQE